MKFNNPNFTIQDKIEILQKWILINSYLYYELDTSRVEDDVYDRNSHQLAEFKERYPNEYSKARYSYAMYDFEGSTGFGFVERLNEKDKKSVVLHVEMLNRF